VKQPIAGVGDDMETLLRGEQKKTPGRLPGDFYLPNLYLKVDCYSHCTGEKYYANPATGSIRLV